MAEHWSANLYGDVGAGDSELTWQGSATIGWRASGRGLSGGYRALGYDVESGNRELDLTIHGLLFGFDFRF